MKRAPLIRFLATAVLALLLASPLAFAAKKDKAQPETLYPNATRAEPKLDNNNAAEMKRLNQAFDALNEGDDAKAEDLLQTLATRSKSRYAKAMALNGLSNLRYQQDDTAGAIDLLKQAIDIGIMPNDTYYGLMYQLAQFYAAEDQYAEAATALQRWHDEGKREMADAYGLEGMIRYRLEQYPQAIDAILRAKELSAAEGKASYPGTWDQILSASYAEAGDVDSAVRLAQERLAANPDDSTTRHNAVSLLIQAERYPEAVKLLEDARARGAIRSHADYVNLAKLYLMIAQSSDEPGPSARKAWETLDDGISEGVVDPSYDVYKLQGDAAYVGDDLERSLEFYGKAAPMAKDGELDVRRGQILAGLGRNDEAIRQIEAGIARGVDRPGNAYLALGAANLNADRRSAAIAAMRHAAEYPETQERANDWLRKAGAK